MPEISPVNVKDLNYYYLKGFNNITTPAGFHVVRTTSMSETPPSVNIEYDQVQTNFGGHWNDIASQFVAPVKGRTTNSTKLDKLFSVFLGI